MTTSSPTKSQELRDVLSKRKGLGEDIEAWSAVNEKIETSMMERILTADTPESIKVTAQLLHSTLISCLLRTKKFRIDFDLNELKEKFNYLESNFETDGLLIETKDESEANDIASFFAETISTSKEVFRAADATNDIESIDNNARNDFLDDIHILSHMIRASKNLIRWNRILFMQKSRSKAGISASSYASSTNILCSVGMVSLYMNIAQTIICDPVRSGSPQSTTTLNKTLDNLAKQSALALFHSTFSQAPEPCCKKALRSLVSELNGCEVVAKLLVAPNDCSVNLMLVVMRLLHNLVGAGPDNAVQINKALVACDTSHLGGLPKFNLLSILVVTLAWSLRSEPTFPSPSSDDKRPDLIIEITRVLFALRNGNSKAAQHMELENQEIMTQMGVLIVDILKLPNRDQRCYECKLAALSLLMNYSGDFGGFLVANNAIEELLAIFWFQLNVIVVEGAGDVQSESNATMILPILIVLNQLVSARAHIKDQVKNYIFPPEDEKNFMAKVEEHRQEIMNTPESKRGQKKNMHPLDAPEGTTRWKLIKLMTWTESNVKRYASELLWNLCKKDPNEFMLRCGFGNAVHFLGIKGLYKIPKS